MLVVANIKMMYHANMPVKPVQVSFDTALLDRIDADPEAREHGRSAFLKTAVTRYLASKARRRVDEQIATAYAGSAESSVAEIADFVDAQSWPDE
jgi:metal-responsive CopG/Arc/MetJ family transcriptional regulator